MDLEGLRKWFIIEVIPEMIMKSCLPGGKGNEILENCEFEDRAKNVDSFASLPSFAKISYKAISGSTSCLSVIIKFQAQDEFFRKKMRLVAQFRNEVNFYTQVMTGFYEFFYFLKLKTEIIEEAIPKCYFAKHSEEKPEQSVVVLQDLRESGFICSYSNVDLDLDHCLIAVHRLAQLHSVSLAMKFLKWEKFDKLKNCFTEVFFEEDPELKEQAKVFKGRCAQRGINYLLNSKELSVPKEYLNNITKKLSSIFDFLKELRSPKEPFSVICHGDFNRNNLLFKYKNGKPVDAKLIDFQTFFYGSLCLDLSFLIYMNTTLQFREKHFEHILKHYYLNLTKTISYFSGAKVETIENWLPFDDLLKEFERVALDAYVIVSFFLPLMMAPTGEDFDEMMKTKSDEEMAETNYHQGGEKVSQRIAEVIVDFYKRNFFLSK